MSRTLLACIPPRDEDELQLLPYLSAYTRQASERGIQPELTTTNWPDLARAHATTRAQIKTAKLLDVLAERSRYPGQTVTVDPELDYPLMDAGSAEEVKFFLEHLASLGLITKQPDGYRLTVEAWQQMDLKIGSAGQPGRAFIAMAFDATLDETYELGMRAAAQECGFEAIRIDKVEHNEKICDRILAEIRRATFVLADFTLHRKGVYFEAGFAMGLGIPVIFACRADQIGETHFDTRQYNHIVWDNADDLRAKLSDRIRATVLK